MGIRQKLERMRESVTTQWLQPLSDNMRAYPASNSPVVDAKTIRIEQFRETTSVITDRHILLNRSVKLAPPEGLILEFGVYKGGSISAMARQYPKRRIVGFDSFEGLPEAWKRSEDSVYGAGHFALPELPVVPSNVTLVKGFFDQSLPPWLEDNSDTISLVNIDVDLYSSAKFVLDRLNDRLQPTAVIVFDELCDWEDSGQYPEWPNGEWLALTEWLAETGRSIRVLGRGDRFQAAIQIVS